MPSHTGSHDFVESFLIDDHVLVVMCALSCLLMPYHVIRMNRDVVSVCCFLPLRTISCDDDGFLILCILMPPHTLSFDLDESRC